MALPALGLPVPRSAAPDVHDLAAVLTDRLPRGQPLILVGHSASCQVVAVAAARRADVAALVLLGPTTDPRATSWPRIASTWVRTAAHEHPWEAWLLAPQYHRTGLAAMVRTMDRLRHHRLDDSLAEVTAPVHVVRGEHDHIAPERWCATLTARPGSSLTTVAGGAHMLPLTHPQSVARALTAALA